MLKLIFEKMIKTLLTIQSRLSIRSYNLKPRSHRHDYGQVVIPLHGKIQIGIAPLSVNTIGNQVNATGNQHPVDNLVFSKPDVAVKQGIFIYPQQEHFFAAHEHSRFLVADLDRLPDVFQGRNNQFLTLSEHFYSFCLFAVHQLNHQVDLKIERHMGAIFFQLLGQQESYQHLDNRINAAIQRLNQDLSQTINLQQLAHHACLSLSHFKHLFAQVTGQSPQQYLLKLRMDKARALLTHSDTPIGLIAEQVGYKDASAFSRRFSIYWGQPPKSYRSS